MSDFSRRHLCQNTHALASGSFIHSCKDGVMMLLFYVIYSVDEHRKVGIVLRKKKKLEQSNDLLNKTQQLTFIGIFGEMAPASTEVQKEKVAETQKQNSLYPIQFVQDFNQFLHYLNEHQVQLTKIKGYISRKYLPHINRLLSIRNEAATSYTEQQYY